MVTHGFRWPPDVDAQMVRASTMPTAYAIPTCRSADQLNLGMGISIHIISFIHVVPELIGEGDLHPKKGCSARVPTTIEAVDPTPAIV